MYYIERIRVYPNDTQKKLIDQILKNSCILYNKLYDYHEYMYWMYGKSISRFKYDKPSQEICLGYDLNLPCHIRKYVYHRLDDAYQRFFAKQNGYPKHKGIKRFRSFSFIVVGRDGIHIRYNDTKPSNSKIQMTGIGLLRAKFTRPIFGVVKVITIKKMYSDDYYAFLHVKGSSATSKNYVEDERKSVIALDLGINKFLTDHLGNYVPQPRFVEYNEKRIRKEQRKLSRMKKGSNNYKKQCKIIAKMYERVSNVRRDWQFKLAHYLVTNYKKIICEDLHVSEMLKKNLSADG